MSEAPVLIVGAGPTGLVLALWLTRLGIGVRIVDKTAEPGTTSRALAVQARTLEFYRQIGIADECVAGGVPIAGLNLWVNGAKAARVPLQRSGEGLSPFPFPLVYPQDAHERLLIEHLRQLGVEVERRTELLRIAPANEGEEQGVAAVLRLPDGTEETVRADYLAGCDGAGSAVRGNLGFGFPGGTYEHLFYVADVEASGPVTNQELHVDLDDTDFLLVFPLQGEGRLRLVGVAPQPTGGDGGALRFDDVRGRALEHMKIDVRRVNWFSTYRVHHRVAPRFRAGRVFLLGDAAHIHSPVGGQGMNTGIGDAVNLAWKLAAVIKGEAAASLLDTYEPERIAFARRLVATTDRVFAVVTKNGAVARVMRTQVFPSMAKLLFRIPRMRRYLFRTVSQIRVRYRRSTLSVGGAGAVRGGDRLPWVETAAGEDNFTPLQSLAWQIHFYGEPRPGVIEGLAGLSVPVHVFPWRPETGRAGLRRGTLYLVRPDGYLGLVDSEAEVRRLVDYFAERELRVGPAVRRFPVG